MQGWLACPSSLPFSVPRAPFSVIDWTRLLASSGTSRPVVLSERSRNWRREAGHRMRGAAWEMHDRLSCSLFYSDLRYPLSAIRSPLSIISGRCASRRILWESECLAAPQIPALDIPIEIEAGVYGRWRPVGDARPTLGSLFSSVFRSPRSILRYSLDPPLSFEQFFSPDRLVRTIKELEAGGRKPETERRAGGREMRGWLSCSLFSSVLRHFRMGCQSPNTRGEWMFGGA